ncbi:MAG: beta-class carbonic anhydrase [Promethearchaeota archaeon]
MFEDIENQLLEGNFRFQRKINQDLESVEIDSKFPKFPILILTCMDPRIDVFRIFQLKPGDAFILRNAGNYYSQDILRSILITIYLYKIKYIIVLGHIDCGMTKISLLELRNKVPKELLPYRQRNRNDLFSELREFFRPFDDELQNIRKQVAILQQLDQYIPDIEIKGMLYDVNTGWVFNDKDLEGFYSMKNFKEKYQTLIGQKEYDLRLFLKKSEMDEAIQDKLEKLVSDTEVDASNLENIDREEPSEKEFKSDTLELEDHINQESKVQTYLPKLMVPKIHTPRVKIYIPKIYKKKK